MLIFFGGKMCIYLLWLNLYIFGCEMFSFAVKCCCLTICGFGISPSFSGLGGEMCEFSVVKCVIFLLVVKCVYFWWEMYIFSLVKCVYFFLVEKKMCIFSVEKCVYFLLVVKCVFFLWQNVYIFSGKMCIVLVERCVYFGGKMCIFSVVKCL